MTNHSNLVSLVLENNCLSNLLKNVALFKLYCKVIKTATTIKQILNWFNPREIDSIYNYHGDINIIVLFFFYNTIYNQLLLSNCINNK